MIKEITEEQKLYIHCFQLAMDDIDNAIKSGKKQTNYNKELKRMNAWNARWIASQYVLITGKMSTLSSNMRDYITLLGGIAQKHYEVERLKENDNGNEKREED